MGADDFHRAQTFNILNGTAEEAAAKRNLPQKQRPRGLKPALISHGFRGPEGPLFHQ
jgi:hypothetical protein